MFIFNPYHMTLRATCNDTMKVFFDGYLQPETAAMGRWNETSYLNIPANTNVLAIECKNSEYQYGILASSLTGLKTDAYWQCSSVYVDGWTLPGFDPPPNTFADASSEGTNGVAPWGVRLPHFFSCPGRSIPILGCGGFRTLVFGHKE